MTMSVYALKPNFSDRNGYMGWKKSWKHTYSYLSQDIRRRKYEIKEAQRSGGTLGKKQRDLILIRADARKMMTLLGEAKLLRDRILKMRNDIAEQVASFPITIQARTADFHFNKIVLSMPFMPKWVLKANGKTWYIDHLDAQMGFSTRELDNGSTLGMLRFRKCQITLDKDNIATIAAS